MAVLLVYGVQMCSWQQPNVRVRCFGFSRPVSYKLTLVLLFGSVNEDQLGSQGYVWLIPFVDERVGGRALSARIPFSS